MSHGIIKLKSRVYIEGPKLASYSCSPDLPKSQREATRWGKRSQADKRKAKEALVISTSSALLYIKKVGIEEESENKTSSKKQ